jgi:uncharacterized protein
MKVLKRLIGSDERFFDLLEASAKEAQSSVQLLVNMMKQPEAVPTLTEFNQARRKDKQITERISEQLCKTFVTPLEREDIEALAIALYKIPKTVEKFSEKYLLCRRHLNDNDFSRQLQILERSTDTVAKMVTALRKRPDLETVKDQNEHLHDLEGEADKLIMALNVELYGGQIDTLKVIILTDLYETLEKIIDKCRDAGNVIFQIVLKYS